MTTAAAHPIQREGFIVGDTVRFTAHGREIEGVIRTFTGAAANQKYPFTVIANGDAYALRASDMTKVWTSTIQHHPLCSIHGGKPCDYDCARDYPQRAS